MRGNFIFAAAWTTNAIAVFFLYYGTTYLQTTFRTGHDFVRLALANVVQNGAALLLVALVWGLSLYGLGFLWAVPARGAFGGLGGNPAASLAARPRGAAVNFKHWKQLLVIGALIFVVGQLYAWWLLLDQTLVPCLTNSTGMGLYKVAMQAVAPLELLPLAVSQVIYPRMAEQYGRTEQLDGLLHMTLKPVLLTVAGMVPLVACCWLLVGPVVRVLIAMHLLLPKYVGSAAHHSVGPVGAAGELFLSA